MTATDPQVLRAAQDWLADDPDPITREELAAVIEADDAAGLADRFAGLLNFGTAGLRGAIGAGPNRMNVAVVTRAAVGVANWIRAHRSPEDAQAVMEKIRRALPMSHGFGIAKHPLS